MYSRRFYCTGSNIRLSQVEYCLGQAPSIGPSLSASSSSLLGWPLCLNCAARSPSQAEAAGVVELEGPVHLGGPSAARSPVTSQAVGRGERERETKRSRPIRSDRSPTLGWFLPLLLVSDLSWDVGERSEEKCYFISVDAKLMVDFGVRFLRCGCTELWSITVAAFNV